MVLLSQGDIYMEPVLLSFLSCVHYFLIELNNSLGALCVIFSAVSFLETDALQGFKLSLPHQAFGIIYCIF